MAPSTGRGRFSLASAMKRSAGVFRTRVSAASVAWSSHGIFVKPDKIANGHWQAVLIRRGEWIDAVCVIQLRHENGDAERIKPAAEQFQIIPQRGEGLFLLAGDVGHHFQDRVTDG